MKKIVAVLVLFLAFASPLFATPLQVDLLLNGLRDTSGNILTGGQIYTYFAGTTLPKVTYLDLGGTIPGANPIVLNASGQAQVYADGVYKFVVYDQYSNLLYTWDNLNYSASPASQYTLFPETPSYVNATQFTVAGNYTTVFQTGLSIQCTISTGPLVGWVATSSYSSPNTTVTVTLSSGSLNSSLSAVYTGFASSGNLMSYGSPTQYQWAWWNASNTLGGASVTANGVACADSSGKPVTCSNLTNVNVLSTAASTAGYLAYYTSANTLGGTSNIPNGTTATTQTASDTGTYVATDAFVHNAMALGAVVYYSTNFGCLGGGGGSGPFLTTSSTCQTGINIATCPSNNGYLNCPGTSCGNNGLSPTVCTNTYLGHINP